MRKSILFNCLLTCSLLISFTLSGEDNSGFSFESSRALEENNDHPEKNLGDFDPFHQIKKDSSQLSPEEEIPEKLKREQQSKEPPQLQPLFDEDFSECFCGVNPLVAELSHIEGKGIGYETGYSTLGVLYMPVVSRRFQPFADLKEHCFNDSKLASNVGLGLRYLDICRRMVLGANFYYDFRRIHRSDSQQFGGGLEYLSDLVDFRLNGYFPFGHQTVHRHTREKQKVFSGVDIEAGMFIAKKRACDWYSLYGAVGGYHLYKCSGQHSKTTGGRARLSLQLLDWIRLEVIGSYDHLFKGHLQGLVAIDCPLWNMLWLKYEDNPRRGSSCETECCFREILTQPVYRQGIIVEQTKR